jgi:NAD(P)-dependent dehydrogenase (short-subunit alcohol dehydrogenase family)
VRLVAPPSARNFPRTWWARVMFPASPASDFMTGQTINVDGGKAMH